MLQKDSHPEYLGLYSYSLRITVVARSETLTAFARSNAGIVCSNPTQSMDVCVCIYSVLVFWVQVAALRRAHPPSKGSYRLCIKDYEPEEEARAEQRTVETLMNEWIKFFLSKSCMLLLTLEPRVPQQEWCTVKFPVRWQIINLTDLRFSRRWLWRMPSSGMWRRVDLVWTDNSEERIAVCGLQPPAHAVFSLADFSALKIEAIHSSETSVHTRFIRRHIPEDGILQLIWQFTGICVLNFKLALCSE
jgi:hypothetical protein